MIVMRKKGVVSSSARVAALAGVLAFSVGVALALLLARSLVSPEWSATSTQDKTVAISMEPFLDERPVPAAAQETPNWDAQAPSSGIIRQLSCKVGEQLNSGQAPFMINDDFIVVLGMDSPPWRDFVYGAEGSDVQALQLELTRLGYFEGEADGYFGYWTGLAVSRLWEAVGGSSWQTDLPLAQLVWIPSKAVLPSNCSVRLGDSVGAGAPLFSLGGGVSSVTTETPTTQYPGPRVAFIGDVATPVPEDGTITDQGFLAAFSQTPQYQAYKKDNTTKLTVNVRLDNAVEVAAVPASALYRIDETRACVYSEGSAIEVTIVASQFGNTLVVPDSPVKNVFVTPPKAAPACR